MGELIARRNRFFPSLKCAGEIEVEVIEVKVRQ